MTKVVLFKVGMTCEGCSGAVTRILSKIQGVENVNANVETKEVRVTVADSVDENVLLSALNKWASASGKSVELIA